MRIVLACLAIVAFALTVTGRADEQTMSAIIVAAATPATGDTPPPKPPPASPATIEFANTIKVVYTLALGTDVPTSSRIAVALASELKNNLHRKALTRSASAPSGAFSLRDDAIAVVPMGGWGLPEYIAQCARNPTNTVGAFIVLPPSTGGDHENYLVLIRENATIAFNVLIADCDQGSPKILWASDTTTGRYGRSVLQFVPFAVLTSVYLAFAPSKTYQTTTTRVFATPSPIPAGGKISQVQTVNSASTNAGGTGSLQSNIVTAVEGAQLAFGRQGNPDHLLMHAAEDAVGRFLLLVSEACPSRPAQYATTDFCSW
jgi:hypothetical protein